MDIFVNLHLFINSFIYDFQWPPPPIRRYNLMTYFTYTLGK